MDEEIVETIAETVAEEASSIPEQIIEPANNFVTTLGDATGQVVEETKSILHIDKIKEFFTWTNLAKALVVVLVIAVIFAVFRILKHLIKKGSARNKIQPHTAMILTKAVTYLFYILVGMYILSLFGVNLNAIWGAAGVAGLAIGFAAQTSVSNVISGLFVLGEKTLKIGDYIELGDQAGTVDSVGLLSVKIRTLNNQVVRIPNSSIIDSNLVNYSSKSVRRFVFEIPLDYNDDMTKALEAVKRVPGMCETVLKDPEPLAFYDGFGDAINLRLAVWFKSDDLVKTKNDVYINIVKVFHEEGLTIPYTHYDVKLLNAEKPVAALKAPKSSVKPAKKIEKKTEKKTVKK